MKSREYTHQPARRERVPMLVGLVGPSGSGKTKSALRLAEGMVEHTGGKIFLIDTEARRALHYAEEHDFQHVEMKAPYSPLDYLAAIEYCVGQGAKVVITDSMSHEHEGPGGVLDMHDRFLDEKCGDDWKKRQRLTMSAWIKPKRQRQELVGAVLRMGVNGIFCFRAKEKVKLVSGKDPIQLGWQAIAGDEFVYEMLVNILLYPGAEGVPNWTPDEKGERVMCKLPEHLRSVFPAGQPIDEETGRRLAHWAEGVGDFADTSELQLALTDIKLAENVDRLNLVGKFWGKKTWREQHKDVLNRAVVTAKAKFTADSVCGKGDPGLECMKAPEHEGDCD